MKLYQFSRKEPCYYCGAPPPSIPEHAPPKMMFDGFECDNITVPSCKKHNHSKSINDRAIITAIVMSAYQEWKRDPTSSVLTLNVIKAIKNLEPNFLQAKNDVSLRNFLIDPPPDLNIPFPYTQPTVDSLNWIRQLTAALVWSVIGRHDPRIEWDKAPVWNPGLFSITEPIETEKAVFMFIKNQDLESELSTLDWHNGWSRKPRSYPSDIYSFDVCFVEVPQKLSNTEIMFRHRFYNNTSLWFIWISLPSEIRLWLRNAVNNTKP